MGSLKKVVVMIMMGVLLFLPVTANAQRGCCSWHGGVAGCNSSGRTICADGTLSPSCTCSGDTSYGGSSSGSSSSTYSAQLLYMAVLILMPLTIMLMPRLMMVVV